jgi:hypothetical protein
MADWWTGESSRSDPPTQPSLTYSQTQYLNNVLIPILRRSARGIPEEMVSGWPTFEEPTPGMTDLQRMSLAGLENVAAGGESGTATGKLVGEGRDVISQLLGKGPQDFEEFYKSSVYDPAMETFIEDTLPTARRASVGAGTIWGSPMAERESRATEDMNDALIQARAMLAFETEKQNVQDKLAALGLIPGVAGTEMRELLALFGAGEGARQIKVESRDARLQEFMRQLQERDTRLGRGAQVALSPTMMGVRGSPAASGYGAESAISDAMMMYLMMP